MASPAAQTALRELYSTVDARSALLAPLLQLHGRLSLLAAQAGGGEGSAVQVRAADALDAPVNPFVDSGDTVAVDLIGDEDHESSDSDEDEEEELEDGLDTSEDDAGEDDDYADDDERPFTQP